MTIYPDVAVTTRRGDVIRQPDMDNPITFMVNVATDRQSTAELTGNIAVKVLRCIFRDEPITPFTRVTFRGEEWDVAIPPKKNAFTKAVSHYEMTIRSRNKEV